MASPRCVLVVDDEESIREIATVSLNAVAGWHVLTAGSAADALELAATGQPDAILLDVMMPTMDGPTLVGRLQAQRATKDIPVIFLTALARAGERRSLLALPGVSGLLAKPFDPMTLAAEVSGILGWEP